MNKLDPFEKLLNAKLQKNEVELSYDSWDAIEKKLPLTPKSNIYYWIGTAIVIGAIAASIIYFNNDSNTKNENNIEENPSKDISEINHNNIEYKRDISESNLDLNSPINVNEANVVNTKSIDHSNDNNKPTENNTIDNITNEKTIDSNVNNYKVNRQTYGPWESQENNIEINDKIILTANFNCSNNNICIDQTIQLNAIDQPNVSYYWDFDDGNYSELPNSDHQFNEPGIYYVQLTVTSDSDPNNFTKSSEYEIIVNDKPTTEINISSIEENGIPFNQFSQNNNEINSIIWDFGDGSKSTEIAPIHRYLNKGNYLITLNITDHNNCSSSISRTIEIDQVFNLMAPNSFTPNGDGINDYFIPESLKIMDVEFTMTIFNKLGKRVYQSKNIDQPWDGIDQNTGQKCQEGNYMWVVQLVNKNGKTEQYKGAILLLN